MPPKTPTRAGRSKSPSRKKTPRGKSPSAAKSPARGKSPSAPPKPAPTRAAAPIGVKPASPSPVSPGMGMPMNSALPFAPPPSKVAPVPKKNEPPASFLKDILGYFLMVLVCMILIPMAAIYSRKGKAETLGWPWPAVVLVAGAVSSWYMQGTYHMSIAMVIMAEFYLMFTMVFYQ